MLRKPVSQADCNASGGRKMYFVAIFRTIKSMEIVREIPGAERVWNAISSPL